MDGKKRHPLDPRLLAFVRNLRGSQTDAETLLWNILRGRRFLGKKFRRQHPSGPYVLDFYCQERRLAIEVDGGQHNADEGIRHDGLRDAYLARQGITILRFWNHEVLQHTQAVLEKIAEIIDADAGEG